MPFQIEEKFGMTYRSDIDGLRAIAILIVLIFHSGLKLFPSGFIGVDIFFVISGFLITRMINESIDKNQFSFVQFYNRRLWRLQPVFICLLLLVTLATFVCYLPDDLINYAKAVRKTSLFVANQHFSRITQGYFAADTTQLPLLHTWSLAIEWQCYLFLPIAVFVLKKLSPTHFTKIVYSFSFVFFIITLYFSAHEPLKTYYQFLSRYFEFLIGSCVAIKPRHSLNKYFANLLALSAFITLVLVAKGKSIALGFPNYFALLVCLATGTLIAIGEDRPNTIMIKWLSFKPVVFIGLISYSLYIWHWPIFAFIHYLGLAEYKVLTWIGIGLSFIVAYLSWRFIEKPARKFNKMKLVYSLAILLLIPIGLTHLNDYQTIKAAGFPGRFNSQAVRVFKQLKQFEVPARAKCMTKEAIDDSQCLLGAHNPDSKRGIMIGDSFSNHSWRFMDILAKDANVTMLAKATPGCLSLPGIALYQWPPDYHSVYQECIDQTNHYFKMIGSNHYDYVVIAQAWHGYLGDKVINQLHDVRSIELSKIRIYFALDQALSFITATGAKPIIIKAIASKSNKNLHDCFFYHIKRRKAYDPKQCSMKIEPFENDALWLNSVFTAMQFKYPQLVLIDPQQIQCSAEGECKADINGIPVFRDISHITDYASYHFAKLYLKRYQNPFLG